MRLATAVSLSLQTCLFVSQRDVAASAIHAHHPNAPRVDLGYATYEGTDRSSGINEFLGMRFASLTMLLK
jgi:hypothetical protein